ncbi:MAG TPA: anti-sigma factor [Kofleriaceae bacterium]
MKRPLNEIEAFRAQELLYDRATVGLDDAQAAELAALGVEDDISFELAAASVDLATVQIVEMPAGVADKILATVGIPPASAQLSQVPGTLAGIAPPRPVSLPQPQPREAPVIPITSAPRRSRAPMVFALVAAAACLALAIGAVLWARGKKPEVIVKEIVQVPVQPSPAEARQQLLDQATDVTTLAWSATPDPAATGASGDVVWSASKQKGFMRFKGLAPNDPTKTQYQLWIFDKTRDEKFPVDGGVFDVGSNGEVIVTISPKLKVNDPTLFAVTVEAPGGVVVSKRERIVVTAAPKAS